MLTISTLLRALYVVCCCCCCCVAAAAESLQSCPTLCDPIDGSPPGSTVPGILQPRTLEWVAISFSSAWKWKVKVKSLSCVWLLATSWTAAYQAPPSMGFSRLEYWSGVPLPSPAYTLGTHKEDKVRPLVWSMRKTEEEYELVTVCILKPAALQMIFYSTFCTESFLF